jgi:mannosyl-3-phosphoglycerate phosphatase
MQNIVSNCPKSFFFSCLALCWHLETAPVSASTVNRATDTTPKKTMLSMMNGWLIFTDLDGTLLNHNDYDYTPALPALQRLKEHQVPVIPTSSKTHAELKVFMEQLDLQGPMVAENGAVIIYPNEAPQIAPPGYMRVRDYLVDCRTNPEFDFLGFGDMSLEEVMESTGLDRDSAELARQRLATEPIIWRGDQESLNGFKRITSKAGYRLVQGGRFLHLLSDTDKGQAVRHVIHHLENGGEKIKKTIALGDSDNDKDMLLAVDIPIIVRKHDGSHMTLPERPDAIITEQPGPAGWNQALMGLIEQYEER